MKNMVRGNFIGAAIVVIIYTQTQDFKLVDSKISPKGVIIASYEPAGPIKLGSMV